MKPFFLLAIGLLFSIQKCICQSADLVFLHGQIITLHSKGDRANAVAIAGDRILAVGNEETINKFIGTKTKVIDLEGRTIVPGFNDVHQHPAPVWAKSYAVLRLDTVSSMKGLIRLLLKKAELIPKGMLIRGVGYNEFRLGGQPTRDILDKASQDHPILITHASGHVSAANSLMLQLNGIDKNTHDPVGGAFERDTNGVPDGIVKESARGLLSSGKVLKPGQPGFEEELAGYRIYFNALLASGITSIGDCWTTPQKVKIYQALRKENFPLRFNLYIGVDYLDQVISGAIHLPPSPWLRIGGIKMFHGNSLSGKTCWLYEPYDTVNPATGKRDYYGIPPERNQKQLDSLVLKIHRAGLQIACHSNGDREIDMMILAIENAQKQYYRSNARHRIEHCSITNQNILEKIKKDSIIPVFHCYINELGNQLLVYGAERLSMIMPTKSAEELGIPYALHSDYPISRYEEEAIRAYTVGGAYTSFEENQKGRIMIGQYADLVVLDHDPVTTKAVEIDKIKVLMTIVGGRIVYDTHELGKKELAVHGNPFISKSGF